MAVSSEIWALTFHSTSHLFVLLGTLGVTEIGVKWTPNLKEFKSVTSGTGYYRTKSKSLILVRNRGVMDKRSDWLRKSRWLWKFANQHFPLLSAWQINGSMCLHSSCVEWSGGRMEKESPGCPRKHCKVAAWDSSLQPVEESCAHSTGLILNSLDTSNTRIKIAAPEGFSENERWEPQRQPWICWRGKVKGKLMDPKVKGRKFGRRWDNTKGGSLTWPQGRREDTSTRWQ